MAPIIEARWESFLLQQGLIFHFHFSSMFFATPWCKSSNNLAIVPPTNFCLLPSCSSRDAALDGVVFLHNKK